ncbi:MAG: flagellar protein FlgN [Clostridia bacterium]|nr:flagellar protein FlgN [Clostridia bacterium]MDQ7791671.1 flagellar protein FlgN [Clostridia bacterium]
MVEQTTATQELLTCLRQEIKIAQSIVQKLSTQQKALQELDLAGLEASLPALEEMAGEMNAAEERRMQAAQDLANALELPVDAPLREILKVVSGPVREALAQARTDLRVLIEEIHNRNDGNYLLILNAARYNRAILQFLSGTSSTYSREGASGDAGQTKSIVLNKKA